MIEPSPRKVFYMTVQSGGKKTGASTWVRGVKNGAILGPGCTFRQKGYLDTPSPEYGLYALSLGIFFMRQRPVNLF
jgi:hypothetical protein